MGRETQTVKALQARLDDVRKDIDRAVRELEKLRSNEALLLDMIRVEHGEPKTPVRARATRFDIKKSVLDLLERAGESGLNAAMAVEMAREQGQELERGSVSSALSRLKAAGVVQYDGNVYRLLQRRGEGGTIFHLRTSGGAA